MSFQQWTLYVRDKRGQVLSNAKSTTMMRPGALQRQVDNNDAIKLTIKKNTRNRN